MADMKPAKRGARAAVVNRLREASTWAGIGTLLLTGAQAWQTRDPQMIGAAVAALVAIVTPERGAR